MIPYILSHIVTTFSRVLFQRSQYFPITLKCWQESIAKGTNKQNKERNKHKHHIKEDGWVTNISHWLMTTMIGGHGLQQLEYEKQVVPTTLSWLYTMFLLLIHKVLEDMNGNT